MTKPTGLPTGRRNHSGITDTRYDNAMKLTTHGPGPAGALCRDCVYSTQRPRGQREMRVCVEGGMVMTNRTANPACGRYTEG